MELYTETLTNRREQRRPARWSLFALACLALLAVGGVVGVSIGRQNLGPAGPEPLFLRGALPNARTLTSISNGSKTWPFVTRVDAAVLIPGSGSPILNGTVVFDDSNRILFAGPREEVPQIDANTTLVVNTVMPGLWDCHTHFHGSAPPSSPFRLSEDFPMNLVQFHGAVQELQETLMMGITSVREVGGAFGQALHELIRTGYAVGPNFHFAGRAIGITSGHADDQLLPLELVRQQMKRNLAFGAVCDGVAECLKRERENLRMQADVIKVMATGGVLSEFDEPTDTELSLEELKAIVEDAKRARRAVGAHLHGTGGIQNAIDAGVSTIEHGTFMTDEQADQIIARKDYMIYVPTVLIAQEFFNGTRPANLDDNQWRKGLAVLGNHTRAVKMAIRKGMLIATGTDCPHRCAEVGKEVGYLHMFGMTPLQAVEAATGNAPRCMGVYGMMPKSGQLKKDYEADVIVLDTNPLEDLTALTRSGNITHVWKGGKLFKSPDISAHGLLSSIFPAQQADTEDPESAREADIADGLPW